MKKHLVILFLCCCVFIMIRGQEVPGTTEEKLENLTDNLESETEDDSYLQSLEKFRTHPLDLNTAEADELSELKILTGLQIAAFISYRKFFGKFISIYELQAVPAWDLATIRKILPYISVNSSRVIVEDIRKRFREGEKSFLLRYSRVLEKQAGYDHSIPGTKYSGSPVKLLIRYRYSYKNLLQYGLTAEKDAGEPFFKGAQKMGFDFYSFHLFASKTGSIPSLALGDFTVNLGQGLIQWQTLAFKKSADVLGIQRQSAVLRPYHSAAEYNFHRGAGITIRKNKMEATLFISFRKLSANVARDTLSPAEYFTSFQNSGYHRTPAEMEDRNRLSQKAAGGNIKFKNGRLQAGINGVYYRFSLPLKKEAEPYNLFSIEGKDWFNLSVDYSYTFKNVHLFGEAAADKNKNPAMINGLVASVDPRVDISFLHRAIDKKFQSVNGYSFTENTYPTNESGWYSGISIRPLYGLRIEAFADFFRFPWLKYGADAPGHGNDFMVQITCTPNKKAELYLRYRDESKQTNSPENSTVYNYLVSANRKNLRTQVRLALSSVFTLRNRVELIWYDQDRKNESAAFSPSLILFINQD